MKNQSFLKRPFDFPFLRRWPLESSVAVPDASNDVTGDEDTVFGGAYVKHNQQLKFIFKEEQTQTATNNRRRRSNRRWRDIERCARLLLLWWRRRRAVVRHLQINQIQN